MTNLVDLRPDRFLRELRDKPDIHLAAKAAGINHDELCDLLSTKKFYTAAIECIRENREEEILAFYEADLQALNTIKKQRLAKLNAHASSLVRGHVDASNG